MPDEKLSVRRRRVGARSIRAELIKWIIDASVVSCSRDGEDLDLSVVEMVAVEVDVVCTCWGGGHDQLATCTRINKAGSGSGGVPVRAAGTTVKLPQNTDTFGLPVGGCGVDGGQ